MLDNNVPGWYRGLFQILKPLFQKLLHQSAFFRGMRTTFETIFESAFLKNGYVLAVTSLLINTVTKF